MPVPSGIVARSTSRPAIAVHDLVQRPVAADRDDERRAAVDRARARARSGGPGRSEKSVSPLQAERARAVRELGPALARRAVVGRRVDEEDGRSR